MKRMLRTKTIGVSVGVLLLTIAGIGVGYAQALDGKTMVQSLGCSNCHLGQTRANPFSGQIPNLNDSGHRYQDGFLGGIAQIPHGRRATNKPGIMPSFPLSSEERTGLAAYLKQERSLPEVRGLDGFIRPLSLNDPSAAARGKAAYTDVYRCDRCHALDGVGGRIGNDLAKVKTKLKPEWVQKYLLAPAVFDPGGSMPSVFVVANGQGGFEAVEPGRDPAQDVSDIMAYLFKGYAPKESQGGDPALGASVFGAMRCAQCHQDAEPKQFAPDLTAIASRFKEGFLRSYLKKPKPRRPFGVVVGQGGRMPDFGLNEAQVNGIATHLESLSKPKGPVEMRPALTAFQRAKATRLLKEKTPCLGCHSWGGEGGRIGPQLMGAGSRLEESYLDEIIQNPRKVAAHSVMPKVKGRPTPKTMTLVTRLIGESKGPVPDTEYLDLKQHPRQVTPAGTAESETVLFGTYCAMCHGEQGKGDGFNARYLDPKPTDLTDKEALSKRPDDTLFDVIHVGGFLLDKSPHMPPWGQTLTRKEIRSLVKRIRTLCNCEQPYWAGDGR